MAKVLFVIKPQSIIDVITNSSTELFVFNGESKQIIENIIEDVYPNYLSEYNSLMSMNEIDDDYFETYLSYEYRDWDSKDKTYLSTKFSIKPEILYDNLNEKDDASIRYWYPNLSQQGILLLKNMIDPLRQMYFLFSEDENPDWEMQKQLMNIGSRYHLG